MPTVNILGMHLDRKQLLIGGGLIAAAVAVVVFLRSRAQASAPAEAPQPTDDQTAGYGGGVQVAAPTQGVADQYQQQLANSQLEADSIANQYQRNLVGQQQKQFDFQQRMQELLAPDILKNEQAELAVSTHFNMAASKAAVSCPGNASLRTGPDGQLYCRQKTSGGVLGIPVGDIFRTVQNFVGGVEAAAPEIGYNTAKQAAQYYTGKTFGGVQQSAPSKASASKPSVKVGPTPALSYHGYEEVSV